MSRECWRRLQVTKTQKSEKQLLFYGYLQKDTSTIGILVFLHPQAIKSYNYYPICNKSSHLHPTVHLDNVNFNGHCPKIR